MIIDTSIPQAVKIHVIVYILMIELLSYSVNVIAKIPPV